jgi:hypothetical protein
MSATVLILVEGPTEARFATELLKPHLETYGVYLQRPSLIDPKKGSGVPHPKGGVKRYAPIKRNLMSLLRATHITAVTTMFDFYARPIDFPAAPATGTPRQRVETVERAFAADIGDQRFIPYLSLHEYEALLFSDPDVIATQLLADSSQRKALHQIREAFQTPEDIDESWDTAPGNRIRKLFPKYSKDVTGSLIATAIGLPKIREHCTHFHQWLTQLEALGTQNA